MRKALGVRHWVAMSVLVAAALQPGRASAQAGTVTPIDLPVGRSYPIVTPATISKVTVAAPNVADVVVIGEREVVINAAAAGETDLILWLASGTREHFRIQVHSPSDRMQLVLYVKFAEVRRDLLRQIGVSGLFRHEDARVGTGLFRSDNAFTDNCPLGPQCLTIPAATNFLTILTDFNTDKLLAFIEAEEQSGRAKILAQPNLMAGNKDTATFLAGGELPIPVARGSEDGGTRVTIDYREFGVRLNFVGEIISDSLIKLTVRPEVSSLDFGNAILISGFRIPAFRTRRITSTLDVKRNESIIISGMFAGEEERVKTGVPLLKDIPVLGQLFSSTRFQRSQSELLVVVTPVVIDPLRPRRQDVLRVPSDTTTPARDAFPKPSPEAQRAAPPPARR